MRRRSDLPAYLGLRAALAAVRVLPRPAALATGAALGGVARRLGMRRAVTDANLAAAFPELPSSERDRIARGVYAHFGRMTVDMLRLSASGPEAVVPYVRGGEAMDIVHACLARGRGCIILTGHVGNWELAAAYVASQGVSVAAVVKPPSNPYVARHTEGVRRRLGLETVPLPEARTAIPTILRQGRAIGLVADQGALRSNIWSPFFGRPTKTPVGPGLFAAETGAPVVFGALVAESDGGYRLIGEELPLDMSGDRAAVVQRAADLFRERLEVVVRQMPEQYLWTHRLWRHQPEPPAPGAP